MQIGKYKETQTDKPAKKKTRKHEGRKTDLCINDRQTDRQKYMHTDTSNRQADKHLDKQIDMQTEKQKY